MRADTATYQANVINYCEANDIRYVIRAKMDSSLKALMSIIQSSDWRAADQTRWRRIGNRADGPHLACDVRHSTNLLSGRAAAADRARRAGSTDGAAAQSVC